MKTYSRIITHIVLIVALLWFAWVWGFCRFYVEPNQMAVVTSKMGDELPPGQILAKAGQKGIQEDVLGEGRHFLNPWLYEWTIFPVVTVPPGRVALVTSKVGRELPEGEFLAGKDEKGIWRNVLGPGRYRLNPYGYAVEEAMAIPIPIGYAGVVTSLSGEQAPNGEFAGPNQKGVRSDVLQPGLYHVNPKAYKVDVLEIGVNQASLLGKSGGEVITKTQLTSQNAAMEQLQSRVLTEQKKKRWDYFSDAVQSRGQPSRVSQKGEVDEEAQQQAVPAIDIEKARQKYMEGNALAVLTMAQFIEFPSRDGFQILLDMTVEIELLPSDIAWIFSRYGDLPALLDKVVFPQITSIARNKGSEYRAKDFIVGEGREKFQTELTQLLADTLKEKKVIVHNALIRHVDVPMQILEPIQQASVAVEQNLTNKERQNTARKQAELNTEQTLIDQRRQEVAQETRKLAAEIKADQEKQTAEIQAGTKKKVAEIARETAGIQADVVRKMAMAKADAVKKVEGEKASGLQLKSTAFGNASAFALWELANQLNPDISVRILHAGTGTLWTDLEKASLGDLGGSVLLKKEAPAPSPKP